MYMKWLLLVEALLNKFTSGIHNSNSIRIGLCENLLKSCFFTVWRHKSPLKNTKILQLAGSGKQQIVTCFNLLCSAFMTPSVGKNSRTIPLLPSFERKHFKISMKSYVYIRRLMLKSCNKVTKYLILWNIFRVPPSNFSVCCAGVNLRYLIFSELWSHSHWKNCSQILNLMALNCFSIVIQLSHTPFWSSLLEL
jgi:hypothetical protein